MINKKTPSLYIRGLYLIFHHFYTVISTYFTLYLAIIVENLHMKPWELLLVMHLYDTCINNKTFYKILQLKVISGAVHQELNVKTML